MTDAQQVFMPGVHACGGVQAHACWPYRDAGCACVTCSSMTNIDPMGGCSRVRGGVQLGEDMSRFEAADSLDSRCVPPPLRVSS